MKRLCTIALILGISLAATGQTMQSAADSARVRFINSIEKSLPLMSRIPVDTIIYLADRSIAAMDTADDSVRMAGIFFDYFSDCPVMGTEAVAVHIADNYFLNGKLKWPDDDSYPGLFAFAEFNRASLIGKSAPPLTMTAIDSSIVDVRAVRKPIKVLYFYEDGCATCVRETPQLVAALNGYEGESEVALFAIYTQSERAQWESYVAANFAELDNDKVTVMHLWDPELESDFQMKYGVLTTPAMFMLDSENTIVGRKLDSGALMKLLGIRDDYRTSLIKLMDTVTQELGANEQSAMELVSALYLRSNGDVAQFRNNVYEIFKYYRSIPLRDAQLGAKRIAENFIIPMEDVWAPETVAEVRWNLEKMALNEPGERATDEKLINKRGACRKMLAGKSPYTVLFFNIAHCNDCRQYAAGLEEAAPLLKSRKVQVVSVYLSQDRDYWLGEIKQHKKWKHLTDKGPGSNLREDYDLAVVPRLYLLDKNKNVIAKDISVRKLCEILENNGQ